jgi:prepilin-type N-terminal cleavage/methylation domain-containing protein
MLRQRPAPARSCKGFTLLETLVAVAISVVIIAGISTSIDQVISVNAASISREAAIKQVENAVQYISRDALQAQGVTTNSGKFPLVLTWNSWSSVAYSTSYFLNGNDLTRSVVLNGGQPTLLQVGHNIDTSPTMTNCSFSNGILTVKLTATTGGFRPASETRTFQIEARSAH